MDILKKSNERSYSLFKKCFGSFSRSTHSFSLYKIIILLITRIFAFGNSLKSIIVKYVNIFIAREL